MRFILEIWRYWHFGNGIRWSLGDFCHNMEYWCCFCCLHEHSAEQTVDLPVIWGALTLMWPTVMCLKGCPWHLNPHFRYNVVVSRGTVPTHKTLLLVCFRVSCRIKWPSERANKKDNDTRYVNKLHVYMRRDIYWRYDKFPRRNNAWPMWLPQESPRGELICSKYLHKNYLLLQSQIC